jgi:type II secretory pathway pseudopilin PulG
MRGRDREGGFTYVFAMFAVAVAAILSTHVIENAMTDERHNKEAELLYIGQVYRAAIMSYYENSLGTLKTYPTSLDDLLDDVRTSTRRRHLRKIYRDPITGEASWGLVMADDGKQIIGVYSLSTRAPLKVGGFPSELARFKGAKSYQDWRFTYVPN